MCLEAVPTRADANRLGSEVVERVEAAEALRGLDLSSLVEDVRRHGCVLELVALGGRGGEPACLPIPPRLLLFAFES
jgi:hypothetical protein